MRTITIVAGVVVGLPLLVTLLASLLPSRLAVTRRVSISSSPERVIATVADLPRRPAWIAWSEKEPSASYVFTGEPGRVGSTMAWSGKEIGQAQLRIAAIEPSSELRTEVRFEKPMAMTTSDVFRARQLPGGITEVEWSAEGELSLFGRFFGLVADRVIGPDYERGLARLKASMEGGVPLATN